MCGRFSLTPAVLASIESLHATVKSPLIGHYNISPGQDIAALRNTEAGKEINMLRWGLIPHWVKSADKKLNLINARSETVTSKPSFRTAFKQRRCLIPADGFYEWQITANDPKQPYYIQTENHQIFTFAGLWESWESDHSVIETCCIITTNANKDMLRIHERMPLIVQPEDRDDWLSNATKAEKILHAPVQENLLTYYAVSTYVNKPANDDDACIRKIEM